MIVSFFQNERMIKKIEKNTLYKKILISEIEYVIQTLGMYTYILNVLTPLDNAVIFFLKTSNTEWSCAPTTLIM